MALRCPALKEFAHEQTPEQAGIFAARHEKSKPARVHSETTPLRTEGECCKWRVHDASEPVRCIGIQTTNKFGRRVSRSGHHHAARPHDLGRIPVRKPDVKTITRAFDGNNARRQTHRAAKPPRQFGSKSSEPTEVRERSGTRLVFCLRSERARDQPDTKRAPLSFSFDKRWENGTRTELRFIPRVDTGKERPDQIAERFTAKTSLHKLCDTLARPIAASHEGLSQQSQLRTRRQERRAHERERAQRDRKQLAIAYEKPLAARGRGADTRVVHAPRLERTTHRRFQLETVGTAFDEIVAHTVAAHHPTRPVLCFYQ